MNRFPAAVFCSCAGNALNVSASALAVVRGRRYVLPSDVHELARDAMRHRLVMSYRALAEGVDADAIIGPVLETVPMPRVELVSEVA